MSFLATECQFQSAARELLGQTFTATINREGIKVLNGIFPTGIFCTKWAARLILSSVVNSRLPIVPLAATPPDLLAYMRSEIWRIEIRVPLSIPLC